MKTPDAPSCSQGSLGRACLALIIALGANSLGFYTLAWARQRAAPTLPKTPHALPVFHAVITPNPEERTRPDLPKPDTQANQIEPEPKVHAPALIAPMKTWLTPLPARLKTSLGNLPGLPLRVPDVSHLQVSPVAPASGIQPPFSLDSVDQLPKRTSGPDPRYPLRAQRKRLQAVITIRFLVSATGTVSHVKIQKVDGHESLAQAAQKAVSQWRFRPARKHGKAVACWSSQEISFKLKDK